MDAVTLFVVAAAVSFLIQIHRRMKVQGVPGKDRPVRGWTQSSPKRIESYIYDHL